MSGYKTLWPILRLLPPEVAHQAALMALSLPIPAMGRLCHDPFEWQGLRFRNRLGIAAGFDKNAVSLPGIERLGAGFVEVGTILVEPWRGNDVRPRVKRLTKVEGIWNRLGFPSQGLERIQQNLKAFPRSKRNGLVVGCNIGPHPGHLNASQNAEEYVATARTELLQLARALLDDTDFFVANLSSPNTAGLRKLLHGEQLGAALINPLRETIRRLDADSRREHPTPLLVKLPPEDAEGNSWARESLSAVVGPLVDNDCCDGFVAVNTSTRLARSIGEDSGGVSGAPLKAMALDTVRLLRELIGDRPLVLGCGGVTRPEDAVALIEAGSHLVELYSGLVYHGPGLLTQCAAKVREWSAGTKPVLRQAL
jgi:dihydroorotate dehydrogenase